MPRASSHAMPLALFSRYYYLLTCHTPIFRCHLCRQPLRLRRYEIFAITLSIFFRAAIITFRHKAPHAVLMPLRF